MYQIGTLFTRPGEHHTEGVDKGTPSPLIAESNANLVSAVAFPSTPRLTDSAIINPWSQHKQAVVLEASTMRNVLLRHAIPLVRTHGFTRQALSIAALSLPTPHCEPLSETAVSALFGPGDEARKTLIRAWLGEGIDRMGQCDGAEGGEKTQSIIPIQDALKNRLKWNEPVLNHLPEAFALLSVPQIIAPFDPLPAISHSVNVANNACFLSGDTSIGTSWYAHRASLALIYTAAELHQLTSPITATQFLDTLLESSGRARNAVADAGQIAEYFWRSWAGIIKSKGLT